MKKITEEMKERTRKNWYLSSVPVPVSESPFSVPSKTRIYKKEKVSRAKNQLKKQKSKQSRIGTYLSVQFQFPNNEKKKIQIQYVAKHALTYLI